MYLKYVVYRLRSLYFKNGYAEPIVIYISGGFAIDRVDSFHVNLRDKSGRSMFIRVEVSLFAATFCSVLSDATNFPPPFRIDNFSEVA